MDGLYLSWLDSNRSELYGPRSPILTANMPGIHEYSDS